MDFESILINWYGPVSFEDIDNYHAGGLYLVSGHQKYQRVDQIQYIGITAGNYSTRFASHHKINAVTRNRRIWLGKIAFPSEPTRTTLERAESILIYAQQPPLNERKKIKLPRPLVLISHWFNPKNAPRYNRQGIFSGFPDVVSWDGTHWREGNLRVFEN
ncbi:hypothetical protein Q1J55_22935 [Pseudomonas syringae]|uniref:hypothetical protein n=1 Tax=Pseudomonas syringae TaxID=317 RepID=UPI0034D6FA95